jgi:hypothetical protein
MDENFEAELENAESAAKASSDDTRITKLEAELAKARKEVARHKREADDARNRLDDTLESMERQRAAKFVIPKGAASPIGGDYCRVVVPDTHGSYGDQAALAAFLDDLERIKPREVILLGDHIDCGGFLAQHQTLGYVAEGDYCFEDDVDAGNVFLDRVGEAAPDATTEYLEGNHEHRIERWIATQTLRNGKDAKGFHKRFSVPGVLHLEQRRINYYSTAQYYDGLSIPGAIKRGKGCYVHGISHADNAAKTHLSEFGCCVVFAHIHRKQSYSKTTVHAGDIAAWCDGCLCQRRPYYMHPRKTNWQHGYGLEMVWGSGEFLHLTVPIIDGKSFLGPLFDEMK